MLKIQGLYGDAIPTYNLFRSLLLFGKKGRRALLGLGATNGWCRQYGSGFRLLGSTTCRALGRLSLGLLRFRWEGQNMLLGKGIRVSAVCLKPRL